MSRLSKYIILIAVVMALPKLAEAKTLTFGNQNWQLNPTTSTDSQSVITRNDWDLKNLAAHILIDQPVQAPVTTLDPDTLKQIVSIQSSLEQPTISAQLTIQDNWATKFIPDQNGQAVDVYKLMRLLTTSGEDAPVPVVVSEPAVKLGDLNDLGITGLVARGESDFSGSSKNRITNVTVGSSKYDGLILQPGQEFSFNSYLGDIDAAHGFTPEQVIKASGIELEFGGGLCQVSTTMFRAAMNAGLPITQRRNHSFAVHYYSPQGTDATIYPGSSDLKFVNDYDTPLLVHTYIQAPHVYFEIYGKKDGRVVTFEGPVQYDRKPDGSMKATWTRHVTKNGETTTYVAKSNYVSPSLYKKVVAVATPNPQAQATPANTLPATQTSGGTKTN